MRHVAVVGASLAGVSAVEALRDRGFDGRITLLDGEPGLPYDKPPLSKQLFTRGDDVDDLLLHPTGWYEERDITLRMGERVVALDSRTRSLQLEHRNRLGFDGLVIASGSSARPLPVPCPDPADIHRLRTKADALRLGVELVPGRHLVVVGAGFIGLEVASVARALGMRVTVLEAAATPFHNVFGPAVGSWFQALHERHGVAMWCGVALRSIERRDGGFQLHFHGGATLRADTILAGVGARPRTEWLHGSGIDVADGVRCTSDLATSLPDVVAAGDVATWHNRLFDETMRVEHWTNAVEQGRHAVATLLGDRHPYEAIPYFWSDQYDAKVRFVGRASAHDEVVVDVPKPNAFIALFGHNGVLRGAVCVNAPRRLAEYREAIRRRAPWDEAVAGLATNCPRPANQERITVDHPGGKRT